MRKEIISTTLALIASLGSFAQDAIISVYPEQGKYKIDKEIYGQFAEHLGTCIYGGLWVGTESGIPNINGYRKDVFEALKRLQVPVLRWPGGCFADDYHWTDGIGPKSQRPSLRNNNWGGTIEDNSFGTHEFLNLCEMLGCEPYVTGNVGSGTVKEMAQWIEYMTSDGDTPMAKLRRQNGREKAWHVKYFGIGNEAWGCGGNMRPEYYSDLYRRYTTYLRDYSNNTLFKIASGASAGDVNWTQVLMDRIGNGMQGISLHYYYVRDWNHKGSATRFSDEEYYQTLGSCAYMDTLISKHEAVMDKFDPQKKIALMVDEWGTWWDEEPGSVPGHLYQQNSLRDAIVAAMTLNTFHKHTDRVRMANIAQLVNVLQSMILTDTKGTGHMVLTPNYYVFEMYKDFQDAINLPVQTQCTMLHDTDNRQIPQISASMARKQQGGYVLALVNTSLSKDVETELRLGSIAPKQLSGRILTAPRINDFNDFSHPETVKPAEFRNIRNAKTKKNTVRVKIPAKSIVVLDIK